MAAATAPPDESSLPVSSLPGASLREAVLQAGGVGDGAPFHALCVDEGFDKDPQTLADFDKDAWDMPACKYGATGLLQLREAMLPIQKPLGMVHYKFLICPSFSGEPEEVGDAESKDAHRSGDRKGKGKGKDKNTQGGRYVQDMGRTEVMKVTKGSQRGQWWRNCVEQELDVIVRELFSLQSPAIWKLPPGHYVQQSGPCEVFVSGKAEGLQRMPVLPRGWVTVDATHVGGPRYLEPTRSPRWKVVFQSGSNRGDIVVREALSLESDETAVLLCGTRVEQSGPQHVLDDGIVRMPITFGEHLGREPSDPSRSPRSRAGWVTCDATAQGGPKFFEPCVDDESVGQSSWGKNRMWKIVNLARGDRKLAVTSKAEPFAPGSGKIPPEEMLVAWLSDGDLVEQVGHSKKVRGNMVMPIRVVSGSSENSGVSGWVTRRLVDKARDSPEETWFVELRNGEVTERGERRKPRRRQDD